MEINYFDGINWVRVSEIVLEGIIAGLTILLAFFLGKLQADIDWRRKRIQWKKDNIELKMRELNNIRISEIQELLRGLSNYLTRFESKYRGISIEPDTDKAAIELKSKVQQILQIFTKDNAPKVNAYLISFIDETNRIIPYLELHSGKMVETSNNHYDALRNYVNYIGLNYELLRIQLEKIVKDFWSLGS